MTTEFGATAWGRAWLSRIQPVQVVTPDRDLPRARSLARRVGTLDIDRNHVTGTVTERGRAHTITLTIPAWTVREARTATQLVDPHRHTHTADLPDELVTELTTAGIHIAPPIETITAATATGSPKRPHVLALCYALTQRLDEEPFLAIQLRTTTTSPTPTTSDTPAGHINLASIDPSTFYDTPEN